MTWESLLSDIGSFSREKLADTRDRLGAALGAVEGRAYGRMQGTARMMRDRSQQAWTPPGERSSRSRSPT